MLTLSRPYSDPDASSTPPEGSRMQRRSSVTSRSARRTIAGLAVAALTLAACGGSTSGDGPLRLVANPWPGSSANAHVAAAILTQELGLTVEIIDIDENAQWVGLADGTLDAVLEVWPSGHADNYATYITELGAVEDAGPLGAVGQIGWFIPTAVLAEYPGMVTWEGLRGNEAIFATTETGRSGRFLAADPSFVQFDAEIIANLGLDLTVVQSGSEAAQLSVVEAAIERGEPVLFYFYTPHWLHARHDLTQVTLPAFSDGCETPVEARECGYPEDVLFKAFHSGLAARLPAAYSFLRALRLGNEDQNAITFAMDFEGLDAAAAAQAWVDANEAIWRTWLP
jgi:glycine betaine/proline transport system substrate-binding protein